MKDINEFLARTLKTVDYGVIVMQENRPVFECADGLKMSIQASENHYCEPRENGNHTYTEVEIGFPSEMIPELMEYAEDADEPTETVYAYVPVNLVNEIIAKHGGEKRSIEEQIQYNENKIQFMEELLNTLGYSFDSENLKVYDNNGNLFKALEG